MKKTLLASTLLLALPSFANLTSSVQSSVSPAMRGEITTTIRHPNATNLLSTQVAGVPSISANISNTQTIKTITIPANTAGTQHLDVTLIDDFLDDVAPNARHYPPNFPNRTTEHFTGENIKHLSDWIEPYASASDATFDVVLRAAKINGMARNLNIGEVYSLRANAHMAKAIRLQPNHAEANFLYGMMISEAGGFNEGKKYLDKAVSLGYVEAEQSLAQADLLTDKKTSARARLVALQAKHPNNLQIGEQIKIIDEGGFYIWKIADNDLSVKPFK
ncbi:MAG: hypothetical protein Q3971_04975 [Moraxella sp.]|nr:hypothetical protein [Moraxella sp.]